MRLDLYACPVGTSPVRADERFHWQRLQPMLKSVWGTRWIVRHVEWTALSLPDGSAGRFASWVLLWGLQVYAGTTKCDGSRTDMLRRGALGGTVEEQRGYVMTTTEKELLAFRWRWKGSAAVPEWNNMGGA